MGLYMGSKCCIAETLGSVAASLHLWNKERQAVVNGLEINANQPQFCSERLVKNGLAIHLGKNYTGLGNKIGMKANPTMLYFRD